MILLELSREEATLVLGALLLTAQQLEADARPELARALDQLAARIAATPHNPRGA